MRRQVANNLRTLLIAWATSVFHISAVLAQTATPPITSSGLNTHISDPISISGKTQHNITGGTRVGVNLFHSFGDFNVRDNHIANFLNNTGLATENILSRVTGQHVSNIFGTIQTTGFGTANLFLMNPSGIVFGPNASLNVGGSVAFTTADYFRLADGVRFNAVPNPAADALLSTEPVAAYGFLGSNPGAITIQGSQLSVTEGQSLSLIGGNITIKSGTIENGAVQAARLTVPNGKINLATTKSPGELLHLPMDPSFPETQNIHGATFTSFGFVHLEPGSIINVSPSGKGKVSLRSGQLVLEIQNALIDTAGKTTATSIGSSQDTIVLTPGSLILSQTSSAEQGPDVRIEADQITIRGAPGSSVNYAELPLTGVISFALGAKNAGNITLQATNNIETANVASILSISDEGSSGDAGNVKLISTHGDIRITKGGGVTFISSQTLEDSSGNTSNVTASAQGKIVLDGAALFVSNNGGGEAGQLKVDAKNLELTNAKLQNDNWGQIKPGDITVKLSDSLSLREGSKMTTTSVTDAPAGNITLEAKNIDVTQGSLISSQTHASGPGGHLKIDAQSLRVTDGAQLKSGSTWAPKGFGFPTNIKPTGKGGDITFKNALSTGSILIDGANSGIFADTEGTGAGGKINLSTGTLNIQNSGTVSASTTGTDPRAIGGSITVTAPDQMNLNNSASIRASTSGPGNAGNILVKANDITISGSSTITASSTGSGNAGTVTIQGLQSPVRSFLIDGSNSSVSTKTSSTGAGGNLSLSSNSILIQNKASISGETTGTSATATGGTIRLDANLIRIERGALVTSSSTGTGSGGNIKLTAGQSVSIFDGASISASSTGTGAAGNIEIDAGLELDVQRGSITTQSTELSGGNIAIRAIDLLRVVEGKISTSAINGGGNGGAITIDPKVVLLQNSDILAQANRGVGGDISITTPVFIADQSSRVDASTPFGLNGRITIQSPTSNLSGTVGQLASKTSPPQVLLQNRCVALAGGEQSTFLLAGREALPGEPSGWLSSPVSMEHWTGEDTAHASRLMARNQNVDSSPVITAHSNKSRVLSLRRLTPPGFLVRTFATEATGCPS